MFMTCELRVLRSWWPVLPASPGARSPARADAAGARPHCSTTSGSYDGAHCGGRGRAPHPAPRRRGGARSGAARAPRAISRARRPADLTTARDGCARIRRRDALAARAGRVRRRPRRSRCTSTRSVRRRRRRCSSRCSNADALLPEHDRASACSTGGRRRSIARRRRAVPERACRGFTRGLRERMERGARRDPGQRARRLLAGGRRARGRAISSGVGCGARRRGFARRSAADRVARCAPISIGSCSEAIIPERARVRVPSRERRRMLPSHWEAVGD